MALAGLAYLVLASVLPILSARRGNPYATFTGGVIAACSWM